MKKILSVILFLITNIALGQSNYYNTTHQYQATIPVGWNRVPQHLLDDALAKYQVKYDVAYQLAPISDKEINWPYISLTFYPTVMTPEDYPKLYDLVLDKNFLKKASEKASDNTNGLISDIKDGEAFFDSKKNMLTYQTELIREGEGKIKLIGTYFLTPRGFLCVFFYDKSESFGKNKNNFDYVINHTIITL